MEHVGQQFLTFQSSREIIMSIKFSLDGRLVASVCKKLLTRPRMPFVFVTLADGMNDAV